MTSSRFTGECRVGVLVCPVELQVGVFRVRKSWKNRIFLIYFAFPYYVDLAHTKTVGFHMFFRYHTLLRLVTNKP